MLQNFGEDTVVLQCMVSDSFLFSLTPYKDFVEDVNHVSKDLYRCEKIHLMKYIKKITRKI